jgi:hypothetical protein
MDIGCTRFGERNPNDNNTGLRNAITIFRAGNSQVK